MPRPFRAFRLAFILTSFVVASVAAKSAAIADDRPNILIILADDLGYSDLGCYGGEIRTPNLDALAANGLRFRQCYNSSRCCPSRASLLTGLYPHQAGIGRFVGRRPQPGYIGRLTEHCVTFAEVLDGAGYQTFACGKWHVNDPGPIARGFDEFYGFVHGYAVDSWNENMMIRLPEGRPQREYEDGDFFATNAITDHAIDFLNIAHESKNKPWLLYVAYQAAHFPVQAPPQLTATYLDTYRKGWDVLRAARLARLKQSGLLAKDTVLPPRGPIDRADVAKRIGSMTDDGMNPAWDSLDKDRREDLAHRMAVYAAMVDNMDQNIGRLVETLRDHDALDNTLIVFMSDNGACAEWEPFGFNLDAKDYRNRPPGHGINGGTPGKPNILHKRDELKKMGGPGSLFSYGCAWANLSNTPLSLYKHYAHEGGIRTPLIAHWPEGIEQPGGLRDHVVHVMDVMATCVELGRAKYPKRFNDHEILPMEGRSLLPALRNEPVIERTLVYEHERNIALRQGDWKLVGENAVRRDGFAADADWRLYNLKDDSTEQKNLRDQQFDRFKRMLELLEDEARRTLIFPAP